MGSATRLKLNLSLPGPPRPSNSTIRQIRLSVLSPLASQGRSTCIAKLAGNPPSTQRPDKPKPHAVPPQRRRTRTASQSPPRHAPTPASPHCLTKPTPRGPPRPAMPVPRSPTPGPSCENPAPTPAKPPCLTNLKTERSPPRSAQSAPPCESRPTKPTLPGRPREAPSRPANPGKPALTHKA